MRPRLPPRPDVDLGGALLAIVCGLHCAFAPALFAAAAAAGVGWLMSETVGRLAILASLLLAGVMLGRDWRQHRRLGPAVSLAAAMLCFGLAEALDSRGSLAIAAATSGGGLTAAAHLLNRRLVRQRPSAPPAE